MRDEINTLLRSVVEHIEKLDRLVDALELRLSARLEEVRELREENKKLREQLQKERAV